MKKLCLSAFLIFCLFLSACGAGKGVSAAYENFSKALSAADAVSFTANVRAEYEHKTARFALSYSERGGAGTVTVIAPELISGISARIEKGGTRLEYGSVSLDTGALDSHGLSPMSALPVMLKALRAGHLDCFREEDGQTVLQLIPDDDYICTVWFDDAMTPQRAEVQSDGRVIIYAEISDWETG